jgi:hypothetical protein
VSKQTTGIRRRPRTSLVGWTALVTGASSGIGAQFARALAAEGTNLVLTARRTEQLQQLSNDIHRQHPDLHITVLPADLAQHDGPARLVADLAQAGVAVDLLVNNAGFGTHERVADEDPAKVADQIQVNCIALAELTTRLLPSMIARHRGAVLNVASTAAFQPVATMAVYAATKAFVLSFTEALWAENLATGVRVLALCPGGTSTEFFATTGKEFLTRGRQTPAAVVDTSLTALLTSRTPTVVSGVKNRLTATGYRFVPRALMARASAATVRSH